MSTETGKTLSIVSKIKTSWSSKISEGRNGNLSIYKLQLEESVQNRNRFCKRYTFGKNSTKENKTILMIGDRDAGKTTLINSMINYILGVKWEDGVRFMLIDQLWRKPLAEILTSQVTAYKINHMDGFQVPYSLTIVDTPEFGDRGIKQDQITTAQIQEFFSASEAIDCIDAVCFVVQASHPCLTFTQKYVFDSILSIFGKDIAGNIMVMVIFADGEEPLVLDAIQSSEFPFSTDESGELLHFKFNISAVFANNNKSAEEKDQMFWKLGLSSMKKFFTSLNKMETKSLTLTREVLKERKQLEVLLQNLRPHINAHLTKLDEISKTRAALEQHKAEMETNKDFEYEIEVTVPKQVKNTTGYFLTHCQTCHYTCDDKSPYVNYRDIDKSRVMKDGWCTVCPGKCAWYAHIRQKNKWEHVTEKRKETYQDLKKRFEEAHGEVMTQEKIFEKLEKEFEALQEIVIVQIEKSQHLERLQEIALKPNPLSTPDYIDVMIESEKQEAKPGFKHRIQSLMEVRKKAVSTVRDGMTYKPDAKKRKCF